MKMCWWTAFLIVGLILTGCLPTAQATPLPETVQLEASPTAAELTTASAAQPAPAGSPTGQTPTVELLQTEENPMTANVFQITTPAFANGETIPQRYTCTADNLSPALAWQGAPTGTRSLALVVDDPDAPSGVFTHWVAYNLPAGSAGLPEGVPQAARISGGGTQGVNDFRNHGYDGPCPPSGKPHRYIFKLYALDLEPALPDNLKAGTLQKAIQGHILMQAEWIGRYQR